MGDDAHSVKEFARFFEPNSGVVLFNKRSAHGMALVDAWIRECLKWHIYWSEQYGDLINRDSDQGALRLAVFKMRNDLSMVDFVRPHSSGHKRIQCHVSAKIDERGCGESSECLFRHGTRLGCG